MHDRVDLAQRIRVGIGGVKTRSARRPDPRRVARPEHVHSDDVHAEIPQLIKGLFAFGVARLEQAGVVLKERLLPAARLRDGRRQSGGCESGDCAGDATHYVCP
jgi:hypothetical protein